MDAQDLPDRGRHSILRRHPSSSENGEIRTYFVSPHPSLMSKPQTPKLGLIVIDRVSLTDAPTMAERESKMTAVSSDFQLFDHVRRD